MVAGLLEAIRKGELGLFYRHLSVFVIVLVLLLLLDVSLTGGGWFFWPTFCWGILLFLHYIVVRSGQVDDEWADRKAADIAENAYDFSHVQDLKDRYGEERADSRKGEP